MRVLLLTPPLTQLNTPYPATSYLTGFLRSRGVDAAQADLSLDTALAVFSHSGLTRLFDMIRERGGTWPEPVEQALDLADAYQGTIEPVVTFLQGRDPTLATRIAAGGFLPEGPRLAGREDDHWAFGSLGTTDRAKHLASLYLDDLSDLISSTVDPLWGLSRYGEQLAASAPSFDPLAQALAAPPGFATRLLEARVQELTCGSRPDLIGLTVPFPGNLYGALRTAAVLRRAWPDVPIVLGGGYANTELRDLAEPRLFDYVDYVTLDAGERPLLCLLDLLAGKRNVNSLCRTFARVRDRVVYYDGAGEADIPFEHTGTPTYVGLDLSRYLSIVEVPNPMHRLWSDGRWNKLTVAHGCYWKRCAFCDVDLDYIKRYEPASAALLLDRIDALIAETGQSGFHFVDEAAPPARLVDLAIALLERGRLISWWGNIRFEAAFTADVCRLLAASGCIAVSGGLETASDRLLALMDKGVTVAQAARTTHHLTRAGIMVHAYLMYSFPTETSQETMDALERVRQFFAEDLVQSGFWHRFTATVHSPVGCSPNAFGIAIDPLPADVFARNDLTHRDPCSGDLDALGRGLARAVYHYMHGVGLDDDVRKWFDDRMPRPKVSRSAVRRALDSTEPAGTDPASRLVWIGEQVELAPAGAGGRVGLAVHGRTSSTTVPLRKPIAEWLADAVMAASPRNRRGRPYPTLGDLAATFPGPGAFAAWSQGRAWRELRRAGLLIV
ncbi:MAG: B12-binding domain-containing radical SAM protein [Nitrospirota bacterium]